LEIKFTKLHEGAQLPVVKKYGDAGADLICDEEFCIRSQESYLATTGITVEIPHNHAGLITPRSGLALEHGLTIVNSPGLIDSGYRGELKVLLYNLSQKDIFFTAGSRIAQLVIVPYINIKPIERIQLSETERGSDGFGSTGS
jgi:dUTP pyrophosphatase